MPHACAGVGRVSDGDGPFPRTHRARYVAELVHLRRLAERWEALAMLEEDSPHAPGLAYCAEALRRALADLPQPRGPMRATEPAERTERTLATAAQYVAPLPVTEVDHVHVSTADGERVTVRRTVVMELVDRDRYVTMDRDERPVHYYTTSAHGRGVTACGLGLLPELRHTQQREGVTCPACSRTAR